MKAEFDQTKEAVLLAEQLTDRLRKAKDFLETHQALMDFVTKLDTDAGVFGDDDLFTLLAASLERRDKSVQAACTILEYKMAGAESVSGSR
jgi:transcription elongation factor GreA-like protein